MYLWAEEIAGNVIFFFEGSIDLSGFMAPTNGMLNAAILPMDGIYFNGDNPPSSSADIYDATVPGEQEFGGGGSTVAANDTGDTFGFTTTALIVPAGYISRTNLSGTMTFTGESFASLGVDPTPFSFDTALGSNTVHMFTRPPVAVATVDHSAAIAGLQKKIRKLQKKMKKAKRKGKKAKAKKLKRKVRKLKGRLRIFV